MPTLTEFKRPEPQLLLPLAGLHLHGAEGGVDSEVAAADRPHVLRRDGGAVEPAAAPGELVRAELAGRLEVAVNVLAGFALLRAGHVGHGGDYASHRGRRLGRCVLEAVTESGPSPSRVIRALDRARPVMTCG